MISSEMMEGALKMTICEAVLGIIVRIPLLNLASINFVYDDNHIAYLLIFICILKATLPGPQQLILWIDKECLWLVASA